MALATLWTALGLAALLAVTCSVSADEHDLILEEDEQELKAYNAFTRTHNETYMWGTYRPNVYFGMRSRNQRPLSTGLMWYRTNDTRLEHLRHDAQNAELTSFGWKYHDGKLFGVQTLVDGVNNVELQTSFVKAPEPAYGGHWAVRISAKQIKPTEEPDHLSVIWYATAEGDRTRPHDWGYHAMSDDGVGANFDQVSLVGLEKGLGPFNMLFPPCNDKCPLPKLCKHARKMRSQLSTKFYSWMSVAVPEGEQWKVEDMVRDALRKSNRDLRKEVDAFVAKKTKSRKRTGRKDYAIHRPWTYATLPNTSDQYANVFVIQRVHQLPFEFDIGYLSMDDIFDVKGNYQELGDDGTTAASTEQLQLRIEDWENKFERTFGLKRKGFKPVEIEFARYAFSNMLGSVAYFDGPAIHRASNGTVFETDRMRLYTNVPSRTFFPRGFLWDDGFHQLLVSRWDPEISKDVLAHWFALMDEDGWIAREQILGAESRSRVPEQFRVQDPSFANPPTIALAVMAATNNAQDGDREFLMQMYPLLERYYAWFRRTQAGKAADSFRWRGRTANHTLTSGLDDYPRAVVPNPAERHVDLHCWVTWLAKMMSTIATKLDLPDEAAVFNAEYQTLLQRLDVLHWNDRLQFYNDVVGTGQPASRVRGGQSKFAQHVGYVGLFPMLLQLLPPDSPRLGPLLKYLGDPQHLMTKYGLRSLSASDPYYGSGEDYWRGPIWLNINYLAVRALHHYKSVPGPNQVEAGKLYAQLRTALTSNLVNQWVRTGYIWEHYSGKDGHGKGTHPFTGWSSLIVLIMAEVYP